MVIADLGDTSELISDRVNRLRQLELLFSNWADSVESSLAHYRTDNRVKPDFLIAEDLELYRGQLREIKPLDTEYRQLTGIRKSHPEYSRAINTLHNLYRLTETEFRVRLSMGSL